jgi:O-succinylbenzoic acid--CoA ligase
MQINWENAETSIHLNPRLPQDIREKLNDALSTIHLPGHLWLATSGSTSNPKLVALSKEAFLCSAQAVNHHFTITAKDRWLNILPLFHVGGLGIHARCHVAGSKLYDYSHLKWDPLAFASHLEEKEISWTSLVPTQVFDLVQRQCPVPKSLRGIVVGGGHLTPSLHQQAWNLGWPLYPSYGMTECCSQIATAKTPEPLVAFTPLDHVLLRIHPEGWIEINSPALFTAYLQCEEKPIFIDPKIEGWFRTEDKGALDNGFLKLFGRGAHFLKIGGENCNMSRLENIWEEIKGPLDAVLIDLEDERLGRAIHLASTSQDLSLEKCIDKFNQKVLPFEKIRNVHLVAEIPRSPLQKLLKNNLRGLLSCNQK